MLNKGALALKLMASCMLNKVTFPGLYHVITPLKYRSCALTMSLLSTNKPPFTRLHFVYKTKMHIRV